MAPKGSSKRTAQETKKGSAAKRSRAAEAEARQAQDPTTKAIEEVIEQAEDLPNGCRQMLITGLQSSLVTPSDERHEVQTLVVGMVEEVIQASEARLQQAVQAEEARVAEGESAKAELMSKLEGTEAALVEKIQAAGEKASALSEATEAVATATAFLAQKQAMQSEGDAVFVQIKLRKAAVEKGVTVDFKAIAEGEGDCAELMPVLQELNFDESLVKALPSTCARKPSERGDFDRMVLTQLETSLTQKLAGLSRALELEAPGVEERAAAVGAVQCQLTAATDLQTSVAEEQASADARRVDATAAVDAAKAALAAHKRQEQKVVKGRDRKLAALQLFQQEVKGPFEILRDLKSSKTMVADAKVPPETEAVPLTVGVA